MSEPIAGLGLSPLESFVVLGAVALVVVGWLPRGARRSVTYAALGATVLPVAVLLATDIRWSMVVVVAGAAAALPLAVRNLVRRGVGTARRAPRWLAATASVLALGLVTGGVAAAWALPVPVFPEPSGPYGVGTTVMEWTDPDRPETATAAPGDRRAVVVQLWYPAAVGVESTSAAQYGGRSEQEARIVAAALADYLGMPGFVLDTIARAHTHSVPDAGVADDGRFPVVLFSPGLGGVRTQNTAWAEDLASRGYVVVALDHPYDSAAVVFGDGRVVRTRVAATGNAATDEKLAVQWTAVRAADLSFVMTQLGRVDRGEITSALTGRLDLGRAAVAGHSLGGAAALQAAGQDHRFAAVVNLDGFPHGPTPRSFRAPVLALTHPVDRDENPRYLPRLSRVLELSSSASYRLAVTGSAHLTFTDAPLFLPPVPALVGSLGRAESVRVTAEITAGFLDATLRSGEGDLEALLSPYGDLTVYPGDGASSTG